MNALSSLPWWAILPLSLLTVVAASSVLRAVITRVVGDHADRAAAIAAPLMPAFGVLFAFLSGFAITAMWSAHSTVESSITMEAQAATTLAWASTATGADTAAIQGALLTYLDAQIDEEWDDLATADTHVAVQSPQLQGLERTVRASTANQSMASSAATELLTSVDQVSSHRAERVSAAGRSMPTALFLALVLTGLALCLNALTLSGTGTSRARVVSASILVVVAVDLAVLLILAGPFVGSQRVSNDALQAVRTQLVDGDFSR